MAFWSDVYEAQLKSLYGDSYVLFGITGLVVPGAKPVRLKADCYIEIAGRDVTAKYDPRLISVSVLDVEHGMDEAVIELDDSEGATDPSNGNLLGRIPLPRPGERVAISLGWPDEGAFKVFQGYIWDLESLGQRRQGRRLRIEAKGAKQVGKEQASNYWGEGDKGEDSKTGSPAGDGGGVAGGGEGTSLEEVMKKAGQGYTVNIDPELGKLKRPFWAQTNESFFQFGERIAREIGGRFKIQGDTASITKGDGKTNALGSAMYEVHARGGYNLLAWRIKPKIARPVHAETRSQWFDIAKGVMRFEKGTVTGLDGIWRSAKQVFTSLFSAGTKEQAKGQAQSDAIDSGRAQGQGWILMDGEPRCVSEGFTILEGAREGVDGRWRNKRVEHEYSRRTGYITRADVEEPNITGGDGASYWEPPPTAQGGSAAP